MTLPSIPITPHTLVPISPTSTQVDFPNMSNSRDGEDGDTAEGGESVGTKELKLTFFPLLTEADVALDMDMVVRFMEDDVYLWEEGFVEGYGHDLDTSTDSKELGWASD